ncbi:MAG: peptidylprolyl isomerase [Proteobacteria bacterium]|nr:peptidylprolyl isomerase [Pseudomonadota bacterium]
MNKLIITFFAILVFSIILVPRSAVSKEVLIDKIVAVVNEDIKTMSDLKTFKKVIESRKPKMNPEEYKDVMSSDKKLLNLMVNETLLLQYAKEQSLVPTKDELDDFIKKRMSELGMNQEELKKQLADSGQTIEIFKDELRMEQVKARIFENSLKKKISVSEDDYKAFFKKEFHQDMEILEYNIQHIVLKSEDLANTVYKKIKNGADFKEMAKQYSEDKATGVNGGEIGFVQAEGLVPELKKAVKNMSPGDVKGPIKIIKGSAKIKQQEFQIIKLSELRNIPNPEYEKNKENIERALIENQFKRQLSLFIDDLKEDAYVKTYI